MKKLFTRGRMAVLIVTAILLIDQAIKIWVKTHMYRGESIRIADWFYIHFTENPGMAFGMEVFNKLFLTSFRIVAAAAIIWYLWKLCKKAVHEIPVGYIVCLSCILAGAIGNIIDCVCYGAIFTESTYRELAQFVSPGEGYAPWFYGKVVDMFYFPLIETNWPTWMPFVGGEHFIFFSPIFNFADAAISCGIVALLIFYNKYLSAEPQPAEEKDIEAHSSTTNQ
ncbi:MAG: lipoprotein signal peptidase [Bacteroidaceae bacterium]|nr:lipoprotein signal peptidase [Bacteroidaceae bacterium]